MLPFYEPLFPDDILRRPYIEPFAGGAAVFGHISRQAPLVATLSDINTELMDLFRLVRDDPDDLVSRNASIEGRWLSLDIPDRKAFYYELRKEYWDMDPGPAATARLYFLMKTGFNGIWQTCRSSRGRYGTPVGLANQKSFVIDRHVVRDWSRRLSATTLLDGSYRDVPVPDHAFVFCDPPYRDSFTTYATSFDDSEQIALIDWCRRQFTDRGATVWLSNRDAGDGFFETHAPDAEIRRFPITYTAGRRKRTAEGFTAKPATELLMVWSA